MAKRNIKGITIEIDGNATPLQKALSTVDKSLKETQKQIKDTNRLLKFDPGNTDLLVQKQKALQDSIKGTEDRLKQLKDAQKQAQDQLARGDISQQQYDALQREIIETEQDLKKLKKEYQDFGSVAKQQLKVAGDQMKAFGDKVSDVGGKLTKNVTGPIAALGGAAIASFSEVDKGYDEMIKKTGATGEEAEGLRDIMESIATSIPTDFETAGNAIGEVSTRFGITGDDLEKLSEQFIKFAKLNNTDVTQSVDSVQKAMAEFGLGAEDASGFLDRLNVVAQETGTDVNKLAQYAVDNAASFKELGMGIDESVTFMGKLDKSGLNMNQVLAGLRKAMKEATKEGKPLDQALSELQDTLLKSGDSTEALNEAYELFGNKAAPAIADAVKEGKINFEDLAGAVTDAKGSIESTFDETQGPIDDFKTTLNQLKVTSADIGSTLLEILTPAIQKFSEILQALKEKWESLTPAQQDMIVKIALIVAAIGPLLVLIGNVITVIGGLVSAIGLIASPVGLVIVAIGALIAAGVLLYKHWDEVKTFCAETWNDIKQTFFDITEGIKNDIVNFVTAVRDNIVNYFTSIYEFWANVWENIKNAATTAVTFIHDSIVNWFTKIQEFWKTTWEKVSTFFSEAWDNMKSGIGEKVEAIKTAIQDGIGNAIQWIEGLPERAYKWGLDLIANFIQGISDKFDPFRNIIESVAGTVADFIGFSEPKKGPLSKFHTFAPDMMKLFAEGIERNMGIIEGAMTDLGENMNITGSASISVNEGAIAPNTSNGGVIAMLQQYLPYLAQDQNIYLDSGALVGGTAPAMNRALGQMQVRERRR